MRSEGTVEIDRSIDEVFPWTHEHVAEWSLVVVEDEVLDEKSGTVGTIFRTVTEENGRRMEFHGEVTRYEPPFASASRLRGDMFDVEVEYFFEDVGGRTRVTQKSTVTGKGFFKCFFLLFGWSMQGANCRAAEKELQGLKRFCELQPPTSRS